MRRSLALMSDGMLSSSTKKAITIASIGWLVFTIVPIHGNDSGGGDGTSYVAKKKDDDEYYNIKQRVIIDEQNIINVLKAFLECH